MLQWISANVGTILISVLLLLAVGAAGRHVWRGRKTLGCGCSSCDGCAMGCSMGGPAQAAGDAQSDQTEE